MSGPPAGVGTVDFAADATGLTATLSGTTLDPAVESVALLLVDAATGRPISLDYGFTTTRTAHPDGTLATVRLPYTRSAYSDVVRAYLTVDAYPAVRVTLALP